VYQDTALLYSYAAKKFLHFYLSCCFTPRQLCTKVANLDLCCIIWLWFPPDGPLQIETCSFVQSYITI